VGQGCAPIRSRVVRVLAVSGSAGITFAACATLSAAAWVAGSPTARAAHVALTIDTSGPLGLSAPLPPLAAGDVQERTVTLRNGDPGPLAAVALTVVTSAGSPLERDAQYGIGLRVDRCSQPWVASNAGTLRCPGTQTALLDWRPVALGISGRSVGGVPAGGAAWLRISARLPAAAPASFQDLATRLQYRFTAA
jgi:hypothetical protein